VSVHSGAAVVRKPKSAAPQGAQGEDLIAASKHYLRRHAPELTATAGPAPAASKSSTRGR